MRMVALELETGILYSRLKSACECLALESGDVIAAEGVFSIIDELGSCRAVGVLPIE